MSATVRLQALDGRWLEVGKDIHAEVMPDSLVVSADDYGHKDCSFTLAIDSSRPWSHITADSPCEIEEEGVSIFEGFVWETPEESDDQAISVHGLGEQFGLDDDLIERTWVHSQTGDWQDSRSMPGANLVNLFAAAQLQADRLLVIQMAAGEVWPAGGHAGFTLDFGTAEAGPLRVVCAQGFSGGDASLRLYVRASDQSHPVSPPAGSSEDAVSAATPATSGVVRGTLTDRRRYLHVFLYRSTASPAYGADVAFWITGMLAFRQTAYESGDASILKVSDLVKDVLPFAPNLSQDTSEIEATTLNLPDASTGDSGMSARQVIDQYNASEQKQARVRPRTKRLQYRTRPTVPKYVVGAWANRRFRHAAITAGEDYFNRAVVTGQDANGFPVRVARHAAELPGALAFTERISDPAPVNPSFDTNTAGWTPLAGTTITRDTGTFDTAPAAGRWEQGGAIISLGKYVEATFTGTFRAGLPYVLTLRTRTVFSGLISSGLSLLFGSVDGGDYAQIATARGGALPWLSRTIVWVPRGDTSSVVMRLRIYTENTTTQLFIDSLTLSITKPTLLDRRHRVRTQGIQVGGTLDEDTGTKFADAFLGQSLATPLQGTLPISAGEVRRYLTGEPVHPRELVNNTGELVHFADLVDPNTGAIGRDGRIVNVNDYSPDDGTCQLEISASRTEFDRLLARHDIVAG